MWGSDRSHLACDVTPPAIWRPRIGTLAGVTSVGPQTGHSRARAPSRPTAAFSMDGLHLLDEDLLDPDLFEEGLRELSSDQCWGVTLATARAELGCRAAGACTPGFIRGKNHLQNKFCENCRTYGVFVRADRVRALPDDQVHNFSNKPGVRRALHSTVTKTVSHHARDDAPQVRDCGRQ